MRVEGGRQAIADWIKGVAIILMVYGHLTHIGKQDYLQNNFVEVIYTFHMPLFLIISGFFVNLKSNLSEAFHKTFRRIMVPYFVFGSLYMLGLMLIRSLNIHTNNSPPATMLDFFKILFFQPRGAYWFLHSLIILQASILASRHLTVCCKSNYPFVILAVFFIAMACQLGLLLPRIAVFFLIGLLLRKFSDVIPNALFSGIFLIGLIALIGNNEITVFSLFQVSWVLAILLFLAGLGLVLFQQKIFAFGVWVGRNSLIILCFHAFFIVMFKPLANLFLLIDATGLLYSFVVTLIATFGSIYSARIFDKLKLSKVLFGVNQLFVLRD
jgi:fucose 4-O-acetylase-like acetyltransferase